MKRCLSRSYFDQILLILADNEDIHKSLDEFKIRPDPTMDDGTSCSGASEKNAIIMNEMVSLCFLT